MSHPFHWFCGICSGWLLRGAWDYYWRPKWKIVEHFHFARIGGGRRVRHEGSVIGCVECDRMRAFVRPDAARQEDAPRGEDSDDVMDAEFEDTGGAEK